MQKLARSVCILLIIAIGLVGCSTTSTVTTKLMGVDEFPAKGKVIYVAEDADFCAKAAATVANCYEAKAQAKAEETSAVVKELDAAGAIAKVEETRVVVDTSTSGSWAGTLTLVGGLLASTVNPAVGSGMLIGSADVHNSPGTTSSYRAFLYNVQFKDGSRKVLTCSDTPLVINEDSCRNTMLAILQVVAEN